MRRAALTRATAAAAIAAIAAPVLGSGDAGARTNVQLLERLSPFPNASYSSPSSQQSSLASFADELALAPRPPECPPCNPFNCLLPAFPCLNNGQCNEYNGQCDCTPGFGGEDCGKPLCGSLADGDERFPRKDGQCECDEGWGGINCNVCQNDNACTTMFMADRLRHGADPATAADDAAVCYKEGFGIREVYQMCDVTNRKILDMLPGRPPQVTFTCDMAAQQCGFQFWIGQVESFYCGLSDCSAKFEPGRDANRTEYSCGKVECACIPGRMLCGEDGSVDISDFLTEEIKGPGKFSSKTGEGSKFEEPAMNQLINDIFGDTYITLRCDSGECLRMSDVPGFVPPPRRDTTNWVAASICIVAATVLAALFLFWYFGRSRGGISLGKDSSGAGGVAEHVPASLQFSDLSYTLPTGQVILDSITGSVKSGQTLAIIGASGSGKSTFLDLLSRKSKRGAIGGEILVNGRKFSDAEYKRVVGFVDQEDTLMGTLTVYETILNSALLRLPRDMSFEDKKLRVLETMHELGILGIRDSRVGESGKRAISGGEKRRVSIACELVTSPSIIFADEPTSGLDSYNAFNVVEALVNLSHTYNRTVIFTIHQPRSNIVALFDKLILLAQGKMIYSGECCACQAYFESVGYNCPPGFNIADYLIDLTMQDEAEGQNGAARTQSALIPLEGEEDARPVSDAEIGLARSSSSPVVEEEGTELATRKPSFVDSARRAIPFLSSSRAAHSPAKVTARVASMTSAYVDSGPAKSVRQEIDEAKSSGATHEASNGGGPMVLRAHKRASWWSQFAILSARSFKNLYRNPMLMLSHYAVSLVVALICGFLFAGITNDIPGFQNRMGLFYFILALFGFGCLTSLSAFASERHLFTRERSNGYYSPLAYFAAKVLFDVVPLRVVPPFILGAIVYAPVGLVPSIDTFWKFILVLILFNLAASSVVLLLSVIFKDSGIANLVGSLVMLFNLLFAGLLINKDKLPSYLQWLETVSFFHAAFEALLVNEVRYLQLTDHRYGVDIEVPAATILSMFGFKAQAFWYPDVTLLLGYFAVFLTLSFIALLLFVKEQR